MEVAGDLRPVLQLRRLGLRVPGGGQLQGEGRLLGDALGHGQVGQVELLLVDVAQQDDDPRRRPLVHERSVEGGAVVGERGDQEVRLARHGVDDQALVLPDHLLGAARCGEFDADDLGGRLAVGDLAGPRPADPLEDDQRKIRLGHTAHLVGDELEGFLLVGALQEGGGDGARGCDPLRPDHRFREEARVLHSDARRPRQRHDGLAVGFAEASGFAGQAEAPVEPSLDRQGHAEEVVRAGAAVRPGGSAGLAVRLPEEDVGVFGDLLEDPHVRRRAGEAVRAAFGPRVDELARVPPGVEDRQGAVRRPGELDRRLHEALECGMLVQPRSQVERPVEQVVGVGTVHSQLLSLTAPVEATSGSRG